MPVSTSTLRATSPRRPEIAPWRRALPWPSRRPAGFVLPRSGLALGQGVTVLNAPGLIDAGYRGEIKVLLINHGSGRAVLRRGERIAQLVIQPVGRVELIEVATLPPSDRGAGGFGSTGS
jgi:dUTP pyrophosphatase